MEITVFGRTIYIFTTEQISKFKELVLVTIGGNQWYRFAVLCFCIYMLISLVCEVRRKKGRDTGNLVKAGLILYIVFLLSTLLFSRPAGERI